MMQKAEAAKDSEKTCDCEKGQTEKEGGNPEDKKGEGF